MAFFEFLGGAVAQARRDIAIAQQTARDKELEREDKISNALTEAKKDLQEEQLRDDAALAIGKTVLNNNPGAGGSKLLENMSDEQITQLGYNHTLQKSKKSDLNDASFVRAVASRASLEMTRAILNIVILSSCLRKQMLVPPPLLKKLRKALARSLAKLSVLLPALCKS